MRSGEPRDERPGWLAHGIQGRMIEPANPDPFASAPSIPSARPITSTVIVSPHRDDAAFSCGILMALLLRHGVTVTILNIFTTSDYAPYARRGMSAAQITAVRRAEDEELLRKLGPGIVLRDLEELDAPLRLGISDQEVLVDPSEPSRLNLQFEEEVRRLIPRLGLLVEADLVVLPLALGSHIDHRIAREAGRRVARDGGAAFYQDLPYAARFGTDREGALQAIRAEVGTLEPLDLRFPEAARYKESLGLLYRSQVAPQVAAEIGAYAERIGGCERIYAPEVLGQRLRATLRQ